MQYQDTPANPAEYLPPPPKKSNKKWWILSAIVISILLVAALVVGFLVVQEVRETRREEAAAAAAKEAKEAEEAKRIADIEACEDEIGDYIDSLADIDARLDVGLTQATLSDLAGAAASEKARVDDSDLSDTCQDAKEEADAALTEYATTSMDWNDCIWDDWCDPDNMDLQTPWARAGEMVDEAKALMRGVRGGDVT